MHMNAILKKKKKKKKKIDLARVKCIARVKNRSENDDFFYETIF